MSQFSENSLNKLQTIGEKFSSALDDFSNSYVNYKLYPEYKDYEKIYSNSKRIIEQLQADLFVTTNDVQNNIDQLNKILKNINKEIDSEKTKNIKLIKYLKDITSDSDSSDLLMNESKSLYVKKYISNITLLIGSILLLFSLFKVYGKNITNSPIQ
jgi:hypothetical protein